MKIVRLFTLDKFHSLFSLHSKLHIDVLNHQTLFRTNSVRGAINEHPLSTCLVWQSTRSYFTDRSGESRREDSVPLKHSKTLGSCVDNPLSPCMEKITPTPPPFWSQT